MVSLFLQAMFMGVFFGWWRHDAPDFSFRFVVAIALLVVGFALTQGLLFWAVRAGSGWRSFGRAKEILLGLLFPSFVQVGRGRLAWGSALNLAALATFFLQGCWVLGPTDTVFVDYLKKEFTYFPSTPGMLYGMCFFLAGFWGWLPPYLLNCWEVFAKEGGRNLVKVVAVFFVNLGVPGIGQAYADKRSFIAVFCISSFLMAFLGLAATWGSYEAAFCWLFLQGAVIVWSASDYCWFFVKNLKQSYSSG